MANSHSIDASLVRSLFDYDPGTGHLTSRKTGRRVGWKCERGYIKVRIHRVWKRAHRIAWLHFYGVEPPEMLDHINGDRADNRIANLRPSDPFLNQQNRVRSERNSVSGLLGVKPTSNGRYEATIRAHHKVLRLGVFDDPEEAHRSYLMAKARMHPHAWIVTHQSPTNQESHRAAGFPRQE